MRAVLNFGFQPKFLSLKEGQCWMQRIPFFATPGPAKLLDIIHSRENSLKLVKLLAYPFLDDIKRPAFSISERALLYFHEVGEPKHRCLKHTTVISAAVEVLP